MSTPTWYEENGNPSERLSLDGGGLGEYGTGMTLHVVEYPGYYKVFVNNKAESSATHDTKENAKRAALKLAIGKCERMIREAKDALGKLEECPQCHRKAS